jgi:CheY-like chemotaxis protein
MSHTVLYIDDSDDNLVLVERMLRRRQDVRLRVAKTGHGGVEAALRDPPNLILLDNRLPDSSGMEVLLQLAASPATAAVPVVVLSGDSGQATVNDLLAAGASDFLAKPFAMAELLATVARYLDDGSG